RPLRGQPHLPPARAGPFPDAGRGPGGRRPALLQGVPGRPAGRPLAAAGGQPRPAVRRAGQRAGDGPFLDRLVQPRGTAAGRPRRAAGGGPGAAALPVPGGERPGAAGPPLRRHPLAARTPGAVTGVTAPGPVPAGTWLVLRTRNSQECVSKTIVLGRQP